ncbi:hypothetical protein EX30DRAFT_389877 [Ascodesmis nigricans]|uniref:Uncharacterized protein n=1 Tax=Ascodesmis nigricans TaxID=341454 RepID=A0A4V3SIZ3_9PEZI|nr:hypothetical protein EX30DRAFT_389877 [Ascodesmis nigricans]
MMSSVIHSVLHLDPHNLHPHSNPHLHLLSISYPSPIHLHFHLNNRQIIHRHFTSQRSHRHLLRGITVPSSLPAQKHISHTNHRLPRARTIPRMLPLRILLPLLVMLLIFFHPRRPRFTNTNNQHKNNRHQNKTPRDLAPYTPHPNASEYLKSISHDHDRRVLHVQVPAQLHGLLVGFDDNWYCDDAGCWWREHGDSRAMNEEEERKRVGRVWREVDRLVVQ